MTAPAGAGLPAPAPPAAPVAEPGLVTVILASRDGERFLDAALAGIAAQTLAQVEVLLVDDGSADGTPARLAAFAARHPRARLLRAGGVGPAAARDLAVRAAAGEYLAIHDDDDVSAPERLERQRAFLAARPEVALVGSAADVLDAGGRVTARYPVPLGPRAIARTLRRAPAFVHGSVMMRRAACLAAGGYRAAFRVAEDYDLYLRLAGRGALANLPERLYAWRAHAGNTHARLRHEHLFFAALARTLARERARRGTDSLAAFAAAPSREAFLASHPLGARLALAWGEGLVREGRVAEARAVLARALGDPGLAPAALGWWALSWPAGWTPRARRARAAAGGRA